MDWKPTSAMNITKNDKKDALNWAAAAETPRGPEQPYLHGYNARELREWSPGTDPYAPYFRSRVPLAKRIKPFQPTQAHPELTDAAKVMNLSADYDKEEWFGSYRYNDSFSRNILKFWQYQDIYASWHGLPVYGSPTEEGEHEYGVVNIPNPAYTDAAHRNGVISLGCWFWPRNIDFGELVEVTEDGRFPIADKMVEMAHYFGFDGYFINQEAAISEEHAIKLMEMLKYLRDRGMYVSIYDCLSPTGELQYINYFNEKNAPWVMEQQDGRKANDSIFINYAYTPERLENSNSYAREIGLDPFEALYSGIENDKFRFERGNELKTVFREDASRTPRTSLALFGTDMVWHRAPNPSDPNMQKYVEHRERLYWSGGNGNPAQSGRAIGAESESWDGIAHFIAERSVIGNYPFATRFNNGHGLFFFLNGRTASAKGWNNMSAQDILPTWQWWTASKGEPLAVDYDYGTAWNGGSSVKAEGVLSAGMATDIRLFKTELPVQQDVELTFTYKTEVTHQGRSGMEIPANAIGVQALLFFTDEPATPVVVDCSAGVSKDWTTVIANLGTYKGRSIAAIGMRIASAWSEDAEVKVNLGELKLTAGAGMPAPKAPSQFKVARAFFDDKQASFYLSWDFAEDCDTDNIWYYDLYRVRDGEREAIGRILDGVYYVKSIDRHGEETITLEAVAVNVEGTESEASVITWQWGDGERAEYSYEPIPAEHIVPQFNAEEDIVLEAGWSRYLNVRVTPATASNLALTWSSSDEKVVEVDERGQLTAIASGTASVTAQAGEVMGEAGISFRVDVKVVAPVAPPEQGVSLQAEQYDRSNGLFIPGNYVHVRDLHFADWMAFDDVDFGEQGVSRITVRAAVLTEDTRMQMMLGGPEGKAVVDMELPLHDGKLAPFYKEYTIELAVRLTGKQNLHIAFTNSNIRKWQVRDAGICDIDWIHFS
ncbi:Ig-like domain-containing protein [Paenibacillus profundus]|uniref:Ig-like domain-containing protein n=1 Tax=Paenibacillus profundus TaxID=1173085 RepID=A0ABS8YL75_9BACL|nr:Ig-like domain-containing protein [Paenibacillus profundus]MCE5171679.1 Ig-like domain-containing protein [Paenibacillus profundus]